MGVKHISFIQNKFWKKSPLSQSNAKGQLRTKNGNGKIYCSKTNLNQYINTQTNSTSIDFPKFNCIDTI